MTEEKALKVGIVLTAYRVSAWKQHLLQWLCASGFATPSLLILLADEDETKPLFKWVKAGRGQFAYRAFEHFETRTSKVEPNAFAIVDCEGLLGNIPTYRVGADQVGRDGDIEPALRDTLGNHDLDVLLWLLPGLPGEHMSGLAKCGVWHFERGDYCEVAPGFWEVVGREAVTASVLVAQRPGHAQVLYVSYSATNRKSVGENRNNFAWKTCRFVPRMLMQLHERGSERFFAENRRKAHAVARRAPNNFHGMRLFLGMGIKRLTHKLERLSMRNQWFLGVHRGAGFPNSEWSFELILPPKDRFWADPFPLRYQGRDYIFIEELTWKDQRGFLSVLELGPNGVEARRVILDLPYHLSYPFVFSYEDSWYMIPETRQNQTIELWQADEFPYGWRRVQTLMEGVAAVDTTLFEHNGLWWMFTAMAETQGTSTCDELFLFYADSPLSTHWTPHPCNPIVSDVRRARPAGRLFSRDGVLYRPAQDCSEFFGRGDQGIVFHEVTRLDRQGYEERPVGELKPHWDKRLKRIHTYNESEGLVVIDALARVPALK